MPTYELSEEGRRKSKSNLLRLFIIAFSIVIFSMITILYVTAYSINPSAVVQFGVFIIVFSILIIWIQLRKTFKSISSIKITFDNDRLVQDKSDKPQVVIKREDVKKIVRIKDEGLRVDSNAPLCSIFVSKDLTGFQDLESKLNSWAIIEDPDNNYFKKMFAAVYGMLALVISAIIFKSKILWGLIFIIMSGLFVYVFVQKFRSEKGMAKWLPVIIIAILILISILIRTSN